MCAESMPPRSPLTGTPLLDQRWHSLVINLDRRRDRMERFVRLLGADPGGRWLLSTSRRLPGVDGASLDISSVPAAVVSPRAVAELSLHEASNAPTIDRKDPQRDPMGTFSAHLTRGALGCALSHRKAWQLVEALDLDWALILEDDLFFVRCARAKKKKKKKKKKSTQCARSDFRESLQCVVSQMQTGWDIVYLGYHGGRPTLEGAAPQPLLVSCGGTLMCGIYGYMLSRAGAQKLLGSVFPLEEQVDVAMARAATRVNLSSWKVADGGILLWSLPSQLTMDTDVQRIR
eukprot:TRINITY_DN2757_c0_g1_i6.p1 TRINITY_DN2757_c0_g1~~TRINITY_DN2757_c0_g1_i6.p1  ORF type:complete len:289 (+),score=66.98 TRINITY_DN2757_c0_g1_i6:232-1098(+)